MPEKYEEQIVKIVEYWSCDTPGCERKHQTEEFAVRCKEQYDSRQKRKKEDTRKTGITVPAIRDLHTMYRMSRDQGVSYAEIGRQYGINGQYVHSLLHQLVQVAMSVDFGKELDRVKPDSFMAKRFRRVIDRQQ